MQKDPLSFFIRLKIHPSLMGKDAERRYRSKLEEFKAWVENADRASLIEVFSSLLKFRNKDIASDIGSLLFPKLLSLVGEEEKHRLFWELIENIGIESAPWLKEIGDELHGLPLLFHFMWAPIDRELETPNEMNERIKRITAELSELGRVQLPNSISLPSSPTSVAVVIASFRYGVDEEIRRLFILNNLNFQASSSQSVIYDAPPHVLPFLLLTAKGKDRRRLLIMLMRKWGWKSLEEARNYIAIRNRPLLLRLALYLALGEHSEDSIKDSIERFNRLLPPFNPPTLPLIYLGWKVDFVEVLKERGIEIQGGNKGKSKRKATHSRFQEPPKELVNLVVEWAKQTAKAIGIKEEQLDNPIALKILFIEQPLSFRALSRLGWWKSPSPYRGKEALLKRAFPVLEGEHLWLKETFFPDALHGEERKKEILFYLSYIYWKLFGEIRDFSTMPEEQRVEALRRLGKEMARRLGKQHVAFYDLWKLNLKLPTTFQKLVAPYGYSLYNVFCIVSSHASRYYPTYFYLHAPSAYDYLSSQEGKKALVFSLIRLKAAKKGITRSKDYWDEVWEGKEEKVIEILNAVGGLRKKDLALLGLKDVIRKRKPLSLYHLVVEAFPALRRRFPKEFSMHYPFGFFKNRQNIASVMRLVVERYAELKGVKLESLEGLAELLRQHGPPTDLMRELGLSSSLISTGGYSFWELLLMAYPQLEFHLKPWELPIVPRGYWEKPENIRRAVREVIGEVAWKHGFNPEDKLQVAQLVAKVGSASINKLLRRKLSSLFSSKGLKSNQVLEMAYPGITQLLRKPTHSLN